MRRITEPVVFIGALNATPEIAGRLDEWARELWPGHRSLGAGSPCQLWVSADLGVLEKHQLEDPDRLLALDGWIWNTSREASGELWGGLENLAEQLCANGGWPLDRGWDGSFALAAYEKRTGALTLAVDPIGLHRLFYARVGRTLVFGNAQSACAHGLGLSPDIPSVALWLGIGYLPGTRMFFSSLKEVMVGERLRFDRDGEALDTAIDVPWHDAVEALSASEAADRLAPLLELNARRFAERLLPGRGGVALSGGMDSRLVLGALDEHARGFKTYTYGGADDQECKLAQRCADAAGADHRLLDLAGRYFPAQEAVRRRAVLGEAIAFPFWIYMDQAAQEDGVETLLMGDITNCLNVYIKPLRGRQERLRRSFGRITGKAEDFDENPMSADQWLDGEINRCVNRAVPFLEHWQLGCTPEEVRLRTEEGYHELYRHLATPDQSLFCLQERFFLAVERGASGGGQVLALAGSREIVPIFSTREIVGAGFNVPFASRSHRALIDEVARRLLPPAIRRLPTATIPLVSIDAPKWSQEAMWLGRFLADAACASMSRRVSWWKRDRLFKTLQLKPEYEAAVRRGYGEPWAVSGVFSSAYWNRRIRRSATGERPVTVPMSEMQALAADSMLAAAGHGPDFLDRLAEMPRA